MDVSLVNCIIAGTSGEIKTSRRSRPRKNPVIPLIECRGIDEGNGGGQFQITALLTGNYHIRQQFSIILVVNRVKFYTPSHESESLGCHRLAIN
jgi:hypothetical protein